MVKTRIIRNNEYVNLSAYDKNQLQKIIKFENRGISFSEGRTCYYILQSPLTLNSILYYSVKIKGAGFYGNNDFEKPGNKIFKRKEGHYGFTKTGETIEVFSDDAPFGGMTLSKAINEYENFEYLRSKGVSTLIPVTVIEYEEILFKDENLAVIISLCTEKTPLRMYKLLWPVEKMTLNERNYFSEIMKSESVDGSIFKFTDRECLIQKIATKYTMEIKKFSDCGMYIHSGGWSNIQYDLQRKNIVLVDLDSSRHIPSEFCNISNLLCIRDCVSNIYRLLISLYNPEIISQYDENVLRQANYVKFLLIGYFPNISNKYIEKASNEILDFFISNCFNKIKNIEYKMREMNDSEVLEYELPVLKFYDFCMRTILDFI